VLSKQEIKREQDKCVAYKEEKQKELQNEKCRQKELELAIEYKEMDTPFLRFSKFVSC